MGRNPSFGNKTEVNKTEAKVNQSVAQQEVAQTQVVAEEVVAENNVVVNEVAQNNIVSNQKNTVASSKSSSQNTFVQNLNEEKVESKKTTVVQKVSKKGILGKLKQTDDVMLLILVILALFIPPIAVGLKKNWALIPLLISIILTLLFVLPGVIHALLVVFDIL